MWKFIILFLILIQNVSFAGTIIGGDTEYIIGKGDNLTLIGARLGVDWRLIARENQIDIKKTLKVGQRLMVNTKRIVPMTIESGIIINIPDRTLYFFKQGRLVSTCPVGIGMPSWRGMTEWRTPEGKFSITGKLKDPTWHVPLSIQKKMEMEGKPVKAIVPPGEDNPLGKLALRTSIKGILIHETIWPTSVYQFRSHGCVRVIPEHMARLFELVETGMEGRFIYEPVKVAVLEGRMFIEVHPDVYGNIGDLRALTKTLIESMAVPVQAVLVNHPGKKPIPLSPIANKIDWQKVEEVINDRAGIVQDITLESVSVTDKKDAISSQ